ncbi:hypothetical protein L905_07340 [Agrobacterium sp. TS43]|uniref:phosphatase domain-containing protein n=1 Tax=Agrobacterium TaxID=357 RepID=UPI00035F8E57|nr:hypothetical protein L902_02185 [Agrobacterium radiobacter DSM 30147]KDR86823.1 phosphatase [Agrobacterium tumefaciens GW4]KVK49964.1 hypothetical protein L903_19000 [Agrobacterium sp. JL28]KVK50254.1 hypothetical protein L904_18990 [Agrobacterium sp. LY4]KVK59297.1 hypothetical protein L905_07340 [Agrobacterium sp. TS43]KVK63011.1 hypothetical protein L906_18130 [Agrobacterium sp. TS45]KVK67535.1 hypothetical protein L907_18095 [Agrobacterium sp. C13]
MTTAPITPISRIEVPGAGTIGMMPCPGRSASILAEVSKLEELGVDVVVSLMQDQEFPDLSGFSEVLRSSEIEWIRLPIVPNSIPDAASDWNLVRSVLINRITNGKFVAIHCWGGLGRTGMIAADLLTAFSHEPSDAITLVRQVRPGTIESEAQERWISRTHSPR